MGIFSLYCFIILLVVTKHLIKQFSLKYLSEESMFRKIWIEDGEENKKPNDGGKT